MPDYRQQDRYSSCALDAAINARIHLGGADVGLEEYERLVDLVRCRYGAALRIADAYPLLGLAAELAPADRVLDLEWMRPRLPVAMTYRDPVKGLHVALIAGVDGDMLSLVNAAWAARQWSRIEFPPPHLRRLVAFRRLAEAGG